MRRRVLAFLLPALLIPALASADYTATLAGTTATLTGNADADTLVIWLEAGVLRHNRFAAGDPGFADQRDWDSSVAGIQQLAASSGAVINVDAAGGADTLELQRCGNCQVHATNVQWPSTATVNYTSSTESLWFTSASSVQIRGTAADTPVRVVGSSAEVFATGGRVDFESAGTVSLANNATLNGGRIEGAHQLLYFVRFAPDYTTPVAVNLGSGTVLRSTLTGAAQVPATGSAATAKAVLHYLPDSGTYELHILLAGITPAQITAAHIHEGASGANGPVIADLGDGGHWGSSPEGAVRHVIAAPIPAATAAKILTGNTYINIHTAAFPDGEIRGQLAVAATPFSATGTGGVTTINEIAGGVSDDVLVGNDNRQYLYGLDGHDILIGRGRNDVLFGGNGNDTLLAGAGRDAALGEAGNDILVWIEGDYRDDDTNDREMLDGGAGIDLLLVATVDNDDLITIGGNAINRTSAVAFTANFEGIEAMVIQTGGGHDIVTVGGLNGPPVSPMTAFFIAGLSGNDTIDIVPSTSVTFTVDGGPHDSADALVVRAQCRAVTQTTTSVTVDGRQPINHAGVETITIDSGVTLTSSAASFGAGGGSGSVGIAAPAGCAWTAASSSPFLSVTSATGAGSGSVGYRVAKNLLTAPRTGTLTIGGQTFTVTQVGAAIAPTSANDFTGDGTFDLLFQHDSAGDLGVWSMNGIVRVDAFALTPNRVPDNQWKIVGSGDFNGDGKPDLVWQHLTDGFLAVWLMNGTTRTDVQFLNPNRFSDPAWRVRAVADFNNDGHPDLVIQHTTMGWVGVWYMNGLNLVDGRLFSPGATEPAWEIVGAPDLNNDGSPDLVFQHTDGSLAAWFMQNAVRTDVQFLSPNRVPHPSWRVRAVGDIDHDGHADLILQHADTGELAAWLMNGITLIDGVLLSPSATPSPLWKLAGPR